MSERDRECQRERHRVLRERQRVSEKCRECQRDRETRETEIYRDRLIEK